MLFALLILSLLVVTLNKVAFELQQFTAETPGDVLSLHLYQRQVVVAAIYGWYNAMGGWFKTRDGAVTAVR